MGSKPVREDLTWTLVTLVRISPMFETVLPTGNVSFSNVSTTCSRNAGGGMSLDGLLLLPRSLVATFLHRFVQQAVKGL
jgi:hypothetical protein